MTPRKASLRVAHSAGCANANKTALESLKGCSCQPSYYVSYQTSDGKTRKTSRVKDRRVADKMLREKQVEIDKGAAGYKEQEDLSFPDWADKFENEILPLRDVKGSTRRTYGDTLELARDAIGYVTVRELGPDDLRRFYAKTTHTTTATRLKHLRHLSACLSAAVDEGLADKNPVTTFRKQLRLRPESGTPPYTDDEIKRLYAALTGEDKEPVYRVIVEAAVETGARVGELIALDWDNVHLLGQPHIVITSTWNAVDGLTLPKDRDSRIVHLTPSAQATFARWVEKVGVQGSGPVFVAPRGGGRLNVDYMRRLINAALAKARIPRDDPDTGRPRKPFHSLRATYTRRMLEAGRHPMWVQAQLGHADLGLTVNTYGQWTADAMFAEAQKQ